MSPFYSDDSVTLHLGDCRDVLAELAAGSVQTCVTSPPYFGLRDYGHDKQIGLEATPDAYVAALVAVFREVKRVLRDDGTVWLNLGDSYNAQPGQRKETDKAGAKQVSLRGSTGVASRSVDGLKPKDLLGIPWRVAFALQADGWYLRSDIIWSKPNPMPESVTDRPTRGHEYVFLLSKSERYFYDAAAIAEPATSADEVRWAGSTPGLHSGEAHNGSGESTRRFGKSGNKERKFRGDHGGPEGSRSHQGFGVPWEGVTRNIRTVWKIATKPYAGAHFATMPPELARRCILAGSKPGDLVLDPFGGAGTTAFVAKEHNRKAVLIEASADYCALIPPRIRQHVLDFGGAA